MGAARSRSQAYSVPMQAESATAEAKSAAVGVTPQMRGRYPGFEVLAQQDHWDEATRTIVLSRLHPPQRFRFFTPAEVATLTAFCDVVLAQDGEPYVPVLAYIDQRLAELELDGFRYADMPRDDEAWRLAAQGLDEAARERGEQSYAQAPQELRAELCGTLAEGRAPGGQAWDRLPPQRAWKVLTRYVLSAFYAHPWAWNEIGFPGPAYPRGYSRLGAGEREGFEAAEAHEEPEA